MKFLNTILIGFLISSQALAGLPPTTAKGQGGSSSVSFETQAPFNQITKTDSVKALVETGNANIIANPGFEASSSATGWTASGGTYTLTTTAANVGSGVNAASWDSSAASQTLTSTAVAIPAGDYGANYEVSANLKCATGTCTHTIQAYDGTNIVASQTITSNTSFVRSTLSFVAPSSGNLSARIVSVAADEPILYVDDVFLGRAQNIGSVAQATLVGTIKITGCAANFSGTSASYANFATQTGCSYAVTGAVEAPTTNVPAARLRNQPPGKYLFEYTGQLKADAASDCSYRFSDGTNSSIEDGYLEGGGTEPNYAPYTDGSIDITSAISDSTFNLQYKKISTGTCRAYGTTAYPGVIKVYRFPSSPEIAVRPELLANSWSGKHGADCSLASGTGSSITDWGGDSTCTFTELTNNNFGTVTSFTNGGNNSAGIVFTPKKAQRYKVCSDFVLSQGGATANQVYQLADGSNNEIATSSSTAITGGNYEQKNICGIFYASSTASQTIKLRINPNGASSSLSAPTGGSAVNWTIFALDQSTPAPVLVGSVTSQSTGAERIERVRVAASCTSSPCTIASQSGSWVSSITRTTTGTYVLNINSGIFASAPDCVLTNAAGGGYIMRLSGTISSTVIDFRAVDDTGTLTDTGFAIHCMGPKGSL